MPYRSPHMRATAFGRHPTPLVTIHRAPRRDVAITTPNNPEIETPPARQTLTGQNEFVDAHSVYAPSRPRASA